MVQSDVVRFLYSQFVLTFFFYWAVVRSDVVHFLYSFVLTVVRSDVVHFLYSFMLTVVQSDIHYLYCFVLTFFLLGGGSI